MSIAISADSSFRYIEESTDEFLALFPHRFDYIYAQHPVPGQKPNWKTERHHPLSDRQFCQGGYLFGVRFTNSTRYCLLDIDRGSRYHPQRDPFAISQLAAALEPLGLVRYLACTSSHSGGIHLYFPLDTAQHSWQLATAITAQLELAGFQIAPGQLEIFPNPRPYTAGYPSLFNAHRLPMQHGSYLLDQDFQPIWSDHLTFVRRWHTIQAYNSLNDRLLKRLVQQAKHRSRSVSGRADKFLHDLNAEIEQGWTDYGQTNRLLGRIAMRTYIFHHILHGGQPLTGQALVDEMVAIARSLPGYEDWCQHQHEIESRASEWARCVENSRYFPYGIATVPSPNLNPSSPQKADPSWNQRQSLATRERIRQAIAELLDSHSLAARTTARFQQLTRYRISGSSLYRHRDLWHPDYLTLSSEDQDSGCVRSLDLNLNPMSDLNSNPSPDYLNTLTIDPSLDPSLNLEKKLSDPQADLQFNLSDPSLDPVTDLSLNLRSIRSNTQKRLINRSIHQSIHPLDPTCYGMKLDGMNQRSGQGDSQGVKSHFKIQQLDPQQDYSITHGFDHWTSLLAATGCNPYPPASFCFFDHSSPESGCNPLGDRLVNQSLHLTSSAQSENLSQCICTSRQPGLGSLRSLTDSTSAYFLACHPPPNSSSQIASCCNRWNGCKNSVNVFLSLFPLPPELGASGL